MPQAMPEEKSESDYYDTAVKKRSESPPLLTALDEVSLNLEALDKTIEVTYKRLDHLILDAPEVERGDTIALARTERSDTVARVNQIADRIKDSERRLARLLAIIEA